jgi:hypothetical protein
LKRYHFFPQSVPKGVVYEVNTLLSSAPKYDMTAIAWQNILEFLQQKWFRRFPFAWFEPWIAWEAFATGTRTRFFYWAPNETIGQHTLDRIALEHFEFNYELAKDPYQLDFSKPHNGMKLFLERDFTVPIEIFTGSHDSLTQLVEHMSNVSPGQELLIQYLIRPVYDRQMIPKFKKVLNSLKKDKSADTGMYLDAIQEKMEQPKAEVAIKILSFADSEENAKKITEHTYRSMAMLNSPELNRFHSREWWRIIHPLFRHEIKNRIFPFRRGQNAVILGTPELAGLARWPTTSGSSKLVRIKMQYPPAPIKVRKLAKEPGNIFVGNGKRFTALFPIYFRPKNLDDHVAVMGGPKSGKSGFILNLVDDLIKMRTDENRMGFTMIDTNGTLANDVLDRIPPEMHDKVTVIRGSEGNFPFNPFDVDYSIQQKGGQVVDILARADSSNWKPVVTETLLLIGYSLSKVGIATLRNIQRVIEEPEFCNWVIDQLDETQPETATLKRSLQKYVQKDSNKISWPREFIESFSTARLRNINTSGISGMMNSYTSGVKWVESWEEGHYVIFDLSGMTPGDQRLIASCIIAHFELGMVSRGRKNAEGRYAQHPLIIDEGSGFVDLFGDLKILSDFYREFNMPLILSTQGLKDHMPPSYVEAFFRNFGTHAVFQLGSIKDAQTVRDSLRSESFSLTEFDYYQISPRHCYMQHTELRSEVFILNPKETIPAKYKGMGCSIVEQSRERALKAEEAKKAEIKLGLKPLVKKEKEDPVHKFIEQLYENDVS